MKNFKLLSVVAVLTALFALPALAENLTVSCTAPTKNTDGTTIDPTATIGFNVYGGMQGSTLALLNTTGPLATCSRTATNVNAGIVCYAVAATETLNGVTSLSAQTTQICTTVAPPTPAAPSGATVTVSVPTAANTIYVLEKSRDQLVMLPAGTVPAGTACDPTQSTTVNGNTFNLVPQTGTKVTWTGTVTSLAAFAKCS